jgi:hypothetical protein
MGNRSYVKFVPNVSNVLPPAGGDVHVLTHGYSLVYNQYMLRESKQNLGGAATFSAFYTTYARTTNLVLERFLTANAFRVSTEVNAGGASIVSEALSAEVLSLLYNAQGLRTEMEVQYLFPGWSMVDYVVEMFGSRVGVSVTRAMGYPHESTFGVDEAQRLLNKKLTGLVTARRNMGKRDSFQKSVLHVFAQSERVANLLYEQFHLLDMDVRNNVVVLCTVTNQSPHLYENAYQR